MDLQNFLQAGKDNKLLLKETKIRQSRIELSTDISSTIFFLTLASVLLVFFVLYYTLQKKYKSKLKNSTQI